MKDQRVAVFVDGSNLKAMQKASGLRLNFAKLLACIENRFGHIVDAYYYIGVRPEEEDIEQGFRTMLASNAFRVIAKPYKVYKNWANRDAADPDSTFLKDLELDEHNSGVTYKANCDVDLTVDALVTKDTYDVAVLVSGDGDFMYLLKALHALGKIPAVVAIGKYGVSRELREYAGGYYLDLERVRDEVELSHGDA